VLLYSTNIRTEDKDVLLLEPGGLDQGVKCNKIKPDNVKKCKRLSITQELERNIDFFF